MKILSLEHLDGLTGLAGLTDRTGVDTRPILLRVLTDLYVQKPSHTAAEERHYVELALRLIDVVDAATCVTVTEKLTAYGRGPAEILSRLATASRNAREQPQAPDAPPADPWLEDDLGIFEPISKPTSPSERKSPAAIGTARDYVKERDAFFAANASTRRSILLNIDYATDTEHTPLAQGTNVLRYLEQSALAGRFQEFTTLLQQALGTSRSLTGRIIADPSGEPFVVSAKALAVPTDVFQRILMFLNPNISHSVDRVYALSDLYAELPLPAALQVVAIWRTADGIETRNAMHRSLHAREAGATLRSEQKPHQASSDQPSVANLIQRKTPSGS